MLDAIENTVGDNIFDGLNSVLQDILYSMIKKLLYYIDVGLCKLIGLLYKMFGIFTGTQPVYVKNGDWVGETDLFSVLMGNKSITTVYWCMVMVGIALCIGFTIIAVIRKMADISGKQQRSYGQIFLGTGKSVLVMLLMTSILSVSISATTALTDAVNAAFNAGSTSGTASAIDFTGEQYAAMARVLNTVGNYSLNTAPTSRYNVNACFNDIRPDLQWLQEQGVFDFYYAEKNADGDSVVSWQSELQKIVNAADLRFDLTMDAYNEGVAVAIRDVMATLKNNGAFRPLAHYENRYDIGTLDNTPLDTILFLMATTNAAKNETYNVGPSIMDNLRGAYYSGDKSIYDEEVVMGDFDISVGTFDHIIIFCGAFFMIPNLLISVFNAIARMFNILMLFLMAPLALSTMPNDDGAKFKQWTTAFVIQCFSILGIIVSMRLMMLFMPVVYSGNVVFFRNSVILDTIAKLLLLIGATEATKKASGIITGILADSAGTQSILAGDMSGFAGSVVGGAAAVAGGAVSVAAGVTGLTAVGNTVKEKADEFVKNGGIPGLFIPRGGGVGNAPRGGGGGGGAGAPVPANVGADGADGASAAAGAGAEGGNKTPPPANSEEFNAQLSQEGSPDNQQNLNAQPDAPSDSEEFNAQLNQEGSPTAQPNLNNHTGAIIGETPMKTDDTVAVDSMDNLSNQKKAAVLKQQAAQANETTIAAKEKANKLDPEGTVDSNPTGSSNKTPPPVNQEEYQQSYGGEPVQAQNYSAPNGGDE